MAFKHQLGITKGQWLCAEAIRAYADLRAIEKNYRTSEPYSDVYKKMIFKDYIWAYKRYIDRVYQLVENHGASQELILQLVLMTEKPEFAIATDMQDYWIHSHLEDNEEYVTLK